MPQQVCGASLAVGICTHVHMPRHIPQGDTHISSHVLARCICSHPSRCAHTVDLQEPACILWKPLLGASHSQKQTSSRHTCTTFTQAMHQTNSHSQGQGSESQSSTNRNTHVVILWSPSKHRQVHCVQRQLVHTGDPSRCWGKGTRVDTQITWLHPGSMMKATEMGPWGGSGILVSRGAEGTSEHFPETCI